MEFSSESPTCLDSEQSGEDSRQSSMTLVKIGNWPKADSNSSQFVTENVVENLNAKPNYDYSFKHFILDKIDLFETF